MWQVQKKSVLKKAEVSKADFRCDSKVTCLARERLKRKKKKKKTTLFNIKIQDKITANSFYWRLPSWASLALPYLLVATSRIFHSHIPSSVHPTLWLWQGKCRL